MGRMTLIHIGIAVAMSNLMVPDPFDFAAKALFPAASILVSMAVAWTSRASTIIQDKPFRDKMLSERNPLESYVYGYQLSLLILILMVIYVAIMAGGGLDIIISDRRISVAISGFWLYFFLSLGIEQCWQVIDFSNLLTLLHNKAKD